VLARQRRSECGDNERSLGRRASAVKEEGEEKAQDLDMWVRTPVVWSYELFSIRRLFERQSCAAPMGDYSVELGKQKLESFGVEGRRRFATF